MGAFAEFERALIRERQREGIALAKKRGASRGRKKALSPEQVADLRRWANEIIKVIMKDPNASNYAKRRLLVASADILFYS